MKNSDGVLHGTWSTRYYASPIKRIGITQNYMFWLKKLLVGSYKYIITKMRSHTTYTIGVSIEYVVVPGLGPLSLYWAWGSINCKIGHPFSMILPSDSFSSSFFSLYLLNAHTLQALIFILSHQMLKFRAFSHFHWVPMLAYQAHVA